MNLVVFQVKEVVESDGCGIVDKNGHIDIFETVFENLLEVFVVELLREVHRDHSRQRCASSLTRNTLNVFRRFVEFIDVLVDQNYVKTFMSKVKRGGLSKLVSS